MLFGSLRFFAMLFFACRFSSMLWICCDFCVVLPVSLIMVDSLRLASSCASLFLCDCLNLIDALRFSATRCDSYRFSATLFDVLRLFCAYSILCYSILFDLLPDFLLLSGNRIEFVLVIFDYCRFLAMLCNPSCHLASVCLDLAPFSDVMFLTARILSVLMPLLACLLCVWFGRCSVHGLCDILFALLPSLFMICCYDALFCVVFELCV